MTRVVVPNAIPPGSERTTSMTAQTTKRSKAVRHVLLARVVYRNGVTYRGQSYSARYLRDHLGRVVLVGPGPNEGLTLNVYSADGAFLGTALNVQARREAIRRLVASAPEEIETAERSR